MPQGCSLLHSGTRNIIRGKKQITQAIISYCHPDFTSGSCYTSVYMKLTVLTWNIWGGKHRAEVIKFLKQTEWDVLALQEVTQREIEGNIINDAQVIACALDCEYYFEKAFRTDRHTPVYDLGNALLSKHPIQERRVHILSDLSSYEKNSTTEPRNAVEIVTTINEKNIHIFSTHIGYDVSLGEGDLQKNQIQELILRVPANNSVLMGDFNSTPESTIIKRIEEHYNHTDTHLSYISWINFKKSAHPTHRIDYIFTTKDITTEKFEILSTDASDHLPLRAVLEV